MLGMPFVTRKKPPRGLLEQGMPTADWPARLTHWAFLLAVILVCTRAMMSETLREPFEPMPGAVVAPHSPGPATSLLLDLLCCIPAMLVLLRRLLDGTYVIRAAPSHAIMGAVAMWMAASVFWASDRFAAMIGAAYFISALAVLWAAVQLVRSWGRLRFVAAAAFALLLVYVAAGLNQRLVNHPVHIRNWYDPNSDTSRWRYMKDHGLAETDFQFKQFESNVLTGSLQLFGTSANTYAAATVLLTVVALSLLLQRLANRESVGWVLAILAPLPFVGFVLYHTHSLTAFATASLALIAFTAIVLLRRWLAANSVRAYWLAVVLVCLGGAAVVGHGLAHNGLVIKTLTFRWYYWTGAAKLVARHPIAGVGWANFGDFYPAVRQALATEEVKDPHNFFVRFFAELGIVGGLLVVAWVLGIWWELTRPIQPPAASAASVQGKQRGIIFLLIPATLIGILNFLFSVDLSSQREYVLLEAAYRFLTVGFLLAGLAAGGFASLMDEKLDERPCPWVLYGMLVALAVFLVHNLIDFSLFETGPMFLFALLAGSALGVRHPSLAGKSRKTRTVAITAGVVLVVWLAAAGFLWAPTYAADAEADVGDAAMRDGLFTNAAGHYVRARGYQPAEAEYTFRAAQALAAQGASHSHVLGVIELAIQTNPHAVRYHLAKADYELRQPQPDAAIVRGAYQQALRLDPTSIATRIRYADTLVKLNDRPAAGEQYREALRLDDALPADEGKRLHHKRPQIEKTLRELG